MTSSSWTIPITSSDPNSNEALLDDYHQVKKERDGLKQTLNHLDDDNRLLRTRCARLETLHKKYAKSNPGRETSQTPPASSSAIEYFGSPKDIVKIQQDYEDLFESYQELQREHRAIVAKHKSSLQIINKQKREIQSLRLRCGSHPKLNANYTCSRKNQTKSGCRRSMSDAQCSIHGQKIGMPTTQDKENVEIALGQLQQRLSTAESELRQLRLSPPDANKSENNVGRGYGEVKTSQNYPLVRTNHETFGTSEMQESIAKLSLLQAQHELDESRIRAQGEKLQKVLSLHNQYKVKYSTLKNELTLYQEENEALECQVVQLEECKEQVEELERRNTFLEDKVKRLCELAIPKEEDGFKREREVLSQELQEKQRAYDILADENRHLKDESKQLKSQLKLVEQYFAASRSHERAYTPPAPPGHESIVGNVWQQLDQARQQNQLLQSQIVMNESQHQKNLKNEECELKKEIISQRDKIIDLDVKASQRQQRIRLLESQLLLDDSENIVCSESPDAPNKICEARNTMVITVHGATLQGDVPLDTKSFVLIDFHTFGSELSGIATGANPEYNVTVSYPIKEDSLFAHTISKGGYLQIEVYTLQEDQTPTLFAHASVPTFTLLDSLPGIRLPRLQLNPVNCNSVDGAVGGSLNVSIQIQKPISTQYLPSSSDMTMASEAAIRAQQNILPDAISITVNTVTLSRTQSFNGSYFLNYNLLGFGDSITGIKSADANGVISYQHKTMFPILSTDCGGDLESVLLAMSKGYIHFTLFSDRRIHAHDKRESFNFHAVGEARIPLSSIQGSKSLTVDITSLEAKVVGTLNVELSTAVREPPT